VTVLSCGSQQPVVTFALTTGSADAARPWLIAAALVSVLTLVGIVIILLIIAYCRRRQQARSFESDRARILSQQSAWAGEQLDSSDHEDV